MMNEINALIWPSPGGVGVLDPIGWNQTVQVAKGAGIIKQDPSTTAYDTSIVAEALTGIEGDTKGDDVHQGHRRGHAGRQLEPARSEQHRRPVPRGAGRPISRAGPPSAAAWTLRPGQPPVTANHCAARARHEHDRRDARLGQRRAGPPPSRHRRPARSSPGMGR